MWGFYTCLWTAEAGKVMGTTLLSCHGWGMLRLFNSNREGFFHSSKYFLIWGGKGSQCWQLCVSSVLVMLALLRHASIRKRAPKYGKPVSYLGQDLQGWRAVWPNDFFIIFFSSLTGLSQMFLSARHTDLEQPNPVFLVWNKTRRYSKGHHNQGTADHYFPLKEV